MVKPKRREAAREGMKKRRMLRDFMEFENYMLMNCVAVSEKKPLLVRAVTVNTNTRKKEGHWVCWLSKFAVNKKKFFDQLNAQDFPYEVHLGHYYLIKKASKEETEIFLAEQKKAEKALFEKPKRKRKNEKDSG